MAVVTGNNANNTLQGTSSSDTITGGRGADTLTGGEGSDTFVYNTSDTVLAFGGTRNAGTVSGFDVITDFTDADAIQFAGATVADDAVGNRLARSALRTSAGSEIRSHSIIDGIITFSTSQDYSTAITVTTAADLAAVVQYLQLINLGSQGATVAFHATVSGVESTMVFIQGSPAGATNNNDILIQLRGVTAEAISDGDASGFIRLAELPEPLPPAPITIDPGLTTIGAWGNSNVLEFSNTDGIPNESLGEAPALAGAQSGIPILAWNSADGVQVQFLDLLGRNDPVGRFTVSDGEGGETGVQVADALAAYGVAWQETGATGNDIIKLRLAVQEAGAVGQEYEVGSEAPEFAGLDNHSFSLSAYDFATNVNVVDPDDPTGTIPATANGINIAWVASASTGTGEPSPYGQVLLQRYQILLDETGHVSGIAAAGLDGQNEAHANRTTADQLAIGTTDDAVFVVSTSGRSPSVAGLHTGETLVAWVENIGGTERVQAQLFAPNGAVAPSDQANNGLTQVEFDLANANLDALAQAAPVAAGFGVKVQEFGPGNFVITWITNVNGSLELVGNLFILPPDNALGDALPEGWSVHQITPQALPASFTGDYQLSGFGEDDGDVVVVYSADNGVTGSDVYAFVIEGDGTNVAPGTVTGHVRVNSVAEGDQSGVAVTGLISNRFLVTYVDADGSVKSRIMDTREPGQFLRGDQIVDRDDNGNLSDGDRVRSRPDIMVGTIADDVIIGDLVAPANPNVRYDGIDGSEDELYGGLGSDIVFGGAGFDILDGGLNETDALGATVAAYTDTAIFVGNAINYNIFINGDGSYSVLDARFDDGANIVDTLANGAVNVDGWDIAANFEKLVFLNGETSYIRDISYSADLDAAKAAALATSPTFTTIDTSALYKLRTQDQRLTGNVALDANGDPISGAPADTDPAGLETVLTPVGWDLADPATAASGFAVAADAAASEIAPKVAATIEGFVTVWEVPGAGGSTLQMKVFDALGLAIPVEGAVPATDVVQVTSGATAVAGSVAIAGTGVGTAAVWIDVSGAVQFQAFDLVNLAMGPTLTVNAPGGSATDVAIGSQSIEAGALPGMPAEQVAIAWVEGGNIMLQRYGFPLDAAGVEGNPVPLGQDGVVGGDAEAPFSIGAGSLPSLAGLHDGELAITYVTADNTIAVRVLNADGSEVLDTNVLDDIAVPAGSVAVSPTLVGAGEGDIVVGWTETVSGTVTTKLAIYRIINGWGSPEVLTLSEVPANAQDVNFAIAGEEDIAVVVTWLDPATNTVVGQRFEYGSDTDSGVAVGDQFTVKGAVISGSNGAAGLLDGRFVSIYGSSGDVSARIFDTRDATDPVIGRDAGGPRDFEVGTIFDDIIDGRDREDTIYGALGNDILIGGINDDSLYGGGGNDDLVGGTGNDTLEGGEGNDLLMGGYGRDYIAGGDGEDTLSYRGEERAVVVDLAAGTVRSDANVNGVGLPDPATTIAFFDANGNQITTPSAAQQAFLDALYNDAGLEDVLGQIIERNHDLEVFEFDPNHGIENIEGGLGNDTLSGDGSANKIWGGAGNDTISGLGGADLLYGEAGDDTLNGGGGADTLEGGAGNDRLNGGGGIDNLIGGIGNDTYIFDGTADGLVENANEGTDTVESSVTFTLASNFENLLLTGSTAINGTGNGDNNVLTGNSANNTLRGEAGNDVIDGGLGNDSISLGTGADTLVFSTALSAQNLDVVNDYSVAEDSIQLSRGIFANLDLDANGTLDNSAWFAIRTGTASQGTTNHAQIVYNSTNGGLFYDADGSGAGASVRFATLSTGLTLTATEFIFA